MPEFCKECSSLMLPSNIDGKKVFKCKCGAITPFSEDKSDFYRLTLKISHTKKETLRSTLELKYWKERYFKSEVSNYKCPGCSYDKAHIKTIQIRGAHKGMTQYKVCLRCGGNTPIES